MIFRYIKLLGNLFIGEMLAKQTDEDEEFKLRPEYLAEIADLLGDGTINSGTAKEIIAGGENVSPKEIVTRDGLARITDQDKLKEYINQAFSEMPKAIADYKKGKTAALKSIVGRVMGITKGKADTAVLSDLVEEEAKKL